METLVIDGIVYSLPVWVIENNRNAVDFYGVLSVIEVISGQEDFDRLGDNDFLESQCFEAYAEEHGVNEGDVMINDIKKSMFAWITDYSKEDFFLVYLNPVC